MRRISTRWYEHERETCRPLEVKHRRRISASLAEAGAVSATILPAEQEEQEEDAARCASRGSLPRLVRTPDRKLSVLRRTLRLSNPGLRCPRSPTRSNSVARRATAAAAHDCRSPIPRGQAPSEICADRQPNVAISWLPARAELAPRKRVDDRHVGIRPTSWPLAADESTPVVAVAPE